MSRVGFRRAAMCFFWFFSMVCFNGLFCVTARVTRFGEFSPIGQLFSLGVFFNWTEEVFWLRFVQSKNYVFSLMKNGLGYTLGGFFKNSSGHPGYVTVKHEILSGYAFFTLQMAVAIFNAKSMG
jgi:hypothetical protein